MTLYTDLSTVSLHPRMTQPFHVHISFNVDTPFRWLKAIAGTRSSAFYSYYVQCFGYKMVLYPIFTLIMLYYGMKALFLPFESLCNFSSHTGLFQSWRSSLFRLVPTWWSCWEGRASCCQEGPHDPGAHAAAQRPSISRRLQIQSKPL